MRLQHLPVALLCVCVAFVSASQGDQAPSYRRCLTNCTLYCDDKAPVFWSCQSDCSYRCQQGLTDHALAAEPSPLLLGAGGALEGLELGRMVQFHGKWPFRRFWFIQEPLSVIFSLGNLWAHYRGLLALARLPAKTDKARFFRRLYRLNAIIGINSWLWSAVFHSRDVPWTEKADYFSAGGAILYGLFVASCRTTPLQALSAAALRETLALICIGAFLTHCTYLSVGRFDYGYNILANTIVGLIQLTLWLAWCARAFVASSSSISKSRARAGWANARRALPSLIGLIFATSLELLDFEPIPRSWRLLDAHAAWHAATVPVAVLWYRFLKRDLDLLSTEHETSLRNDRNRGTVWL